MNPGGIAISVEPRPLSPMFVIIPWYVASWLTVIWVGDIVAVKEYVFACTSMNWFDVKNNVNSNKMVTRVFCTSSWFIDISLFSSSCALVLIFILNIETSYTI